MRVDEDLAGGKKETKQDGTNKESYYPKKEEVNDSERHIDKRERLDGTETREKM